jgi:DNA sulfur modification protein DndD
VIECLQAIRYRQQELFRHQLQEKVREIFSQVSFSGYIPQVTEKYELILTSPHLTDKEDNSQPIPASTGENQLLSLSFIGAIIERVRQWSREKVLAVSDSSSFPIVMDTLRQPRSSRPLPSPPVSANNISLSTTVPAKTYP